MYQKIFIGFFIAAFVCGILLCCGGAAEAGQGIFLPPVKPPVILWNVLNFALLILAIFI